MDSEFNDCFWLFLTAVGNAKARDLELAEYAGRIWRNDVCDEDKETVSSGDEDRAGTRIDGTA